MARSTTHYLSNKELLKEIHNSKMSYCWVKDEKYFYYDYIVNSLNEITPETIQLAKESRAARLQKNAYDAEVKAWENGLTGKKTKPRAADFSVDLDALTILAIIFDYIVSFLSYFFDNIYFVDLIVINNRDVLRILFHPSLF